MCFAGSGGFVRGGGGVFDLRGKDAGGGRADGAFTDIIIPQQKTRVYLPLIELHFNTMRAMHGRQGLKASAACVLCETAIAPGLVEAGAMVTPPFRAQ